MFRYLSVWLFVMLSLKASVYQDPQMSLCERIDKADKQAVAMWEQFGDANAAMLLLENSGIDTYIRNHAMHSTCFAKEKNESILERYGFYALKASKVRHSDHRTIRVLEQLSLLLPGNKTFHEALIFLYAKNPNSRDKAIEHYRAYETLLKVDGKPIEHTPEMMKFLEENGLIPLRHTWGDFLHGNQPVPANSFTMYHINTNEPGKILSKSTTRYIGLTMTPTTYKLLGNLNDFGAYWIGSMDFEQDREMRINVDISWAKARLIVDGYVVANIENSTRPIDHLFTKGRHKIEVEYINNWHTVGFNLTISPKVEIHSAAAIKAKLAGIVSQESDLWYAGVGKSTLRDNVVKLTLKEHSRPVVLVLGSNHAVRWEINKPEPLKIEAIVYSAGRGDSEITGNISPDTPIFLTHQTGGSRMGRDKTFCMPGQHFEGYRGDVLKTSEQLAAMTGKVLRGTVMKPDGGYMTLPSVILNDARYAQLRARDASLAELKQECLKPRNSDFDDIRTNVNQVTLPEVEPTPVEAYHPGAQLYRKCSQCHGSSGEKSALGKSRIIRSMSVEQIVKALRGYQKGTYGGPMKSLMKGQVNRLTEEEIKSLAEYVSNKLGAD